MQNWKQPKGTGLVSILAMGTDRVVKQQGEDLKQGW